MISIRKPSTVLEDGVLSGCSTSSYILFVQTARTARRLRSTTSRRSRSHQVKHLIFRIFLLFVVLVICPGRSRANDFQMGSHGAGDPVIGVTVNEVRERLTHEAIRCARPGARTTKSLKMNDLDASDGGGVGKSFRIMSVRQPSIGGICER